MLTFYLSLTKSDNEKEKLELLYLKYKALMLNRAYEILRDGKLAEDAVHSAFLKVLKNLSKLDEVESVKTKAYIMVVLENTAKTMYTKEKNYVPSELSENIPDITNVQRDTEVKLTAEAAAEKIALLPEKYRDVLILRCINELNDKEIASALGISASAARKRLQRAREKLRKLLGGDYE
jgi:RNA polymerase sigma-70 factor (ECF subfamily)